MRECPLIKHVNHTVCIDPKCPVSLFSPLCRDTLLVLYKDQGLSLRSEFYFKLCTCTLKVFLCACVFSQS